jgi:hypothetical protein
MRRARRSRRRRHRTPRSRARRFRRGSGAPRRAAQLRSPRERVRAGGGDQPLRHPVAGPSRRRGRRPARPARPPASSSSSSRYSQAPARIPGAPGLRRSGNSPLLLLHQPVVADRARHLRPVPTAVLELDGGVERLTRPLDHGGAVLWAPRPGTTSQLMPWSSSASCTLQQGPNLAVFRQRCSVTAKPTSSSPKTDPTPARQ